MQIRKLAAAAALALGALSAGSAVAHADPDVTPSQPAVPPSQQAVAPSQPGEPAPGANAVRPVDPLPPGRGYATPPGRRTALEGVVPTWAPPPPRPPQWAPWLPVAWDSAQSAWGVWWNGVFIRL